MATLYIFLDEGGNFDFSPGGTRYFTLTSVTWCRPFRLNTILDGYKYDLIEYGKDLEYFHCAENNQHIRKKVFQRIEDHRDLFRIDSVVVEKSKTGPALREPARFYPEMLGYLLRYVLKREIQPPISEVVIITDAIPLKKIRKAVEKGAKQTLAKMLPDGIKYKVLHHASKSHYGLQIADYCNWAIYRKWNTNDRLHYDQVGPAISSEFDIFRAGVMHYY